MRNTKITSLNELRQATHWRKENASEVFRTDSAWEWFKRDHREELVATGVLIPGRGRRGDLVGAGIDNVVMGILRREAGQKKNEAAHTALTISTAAEVRE